MPYKKLFLTGMIYLWCLIYNEYRNHARSPEVVVNMELIIIPEQINILL